MNTSLTYAWSQLKASKKSALFLLLSIFLSSMLIAAVCTEAFLGWQREGSYLRQKAGDYHASLRETIPRDSLPLIGENPEVEAMLLQTDWEYLKLKDTKRAYITISRLNQEWWDSMPNKSLLKEGRIPQKNGEIMINTQFFTENPQYQVGDTLTLPAGMRVLDGKTLEYGTMGLPGETFAPSGEMKVTITGIMDMEGVSDYPCYTAYGYIDRSEPFPDTNYKVRLRLSHPRMAYEIMPQIAENLNLHPDADGTWPVSYHENLLELYGIKDPAQPESSEPSPYLVFGILGTLGVILLFVIIIYNAFSVTARSQLRQLGILKSIGASPGQIRASVLWQGLLCALLTVPAGILCGFFLIKGLIWSVAGSRTSTDLYSGSDLTAIPASVPWQLLFLCAAAAVLTVLLSAWGPARRLAKLTPIEAVKETSPAHRKEGIKKIKSGKIRSRKSGAKKPAFRKPRLAARLFGYTGELAENTLNTGKKAYRATSLCIGLCITLMIGAVGMLSAASLSNRIELSYFWQNQKIMLSTVQDPPQEMLEELKNLPGLKSQTVYRRVLSGISLTKEQLHPDFISAGGFAQESQGLGDYYDEQTPFLPVMLVGLSPEDFAAYCEANQIPPDVIQNIRDEQNPSVILVNRPDGSRRATWDKYQIADTPYLSLLPGDRIDITEKTSADQEGADGKNTVTIAAVTDTYAGIDDDAYPFNLEILTTMDHYRHMMNSYTMQGTVDQYTCYIGQSFDETAGLQETKEQAEKIISRWYGEQDYLVRTVQDEHTEFDEAINATKTLAVIFSLFMGVIGVSGAFSAVSGSIAARRKQFVILRSAGLSPEELMRMFRIESLLLILTPALISAVLGLFTILLSAKLFYYPTVTGLLTSMPWPLMLALIFLILGSVFVTYTLCGRIVSREPIVETLRKELG